MKTVKLDLNHFALPIKNPHNVYFRKDFVDFVCQFKGNVVSTIEYGVDLI